MKRNEREKSLAWNQFIGQKRKFTSLLNVHLFHSIGTNKLFDKACVSTHDIVHEHDGKEEERQYERKKMAFYYFGIEWTNDGKKRKKEKLIETNNEPFPLTVKCEVRIFYMCVWCREFHEKSPNYLTYCLILCRKHLIFQLHSFYECKWWISFVILSVQFWMTKQKTGIQFQINRYLLLETKANSWNGCR